MKAERDRYVSFAFAAADLLLELDSQGQVTFAAGSTTSMTSRSVEALIGSPFESLLEARDIETCRRVMAQLPTRQLVGPVHLQISACPVPTMMRAIKVVDDGLIRVAVSKLPPGCGFADRVYDKVTGLLERESFVDMAERHLADARDLGQDRELAMVRVQGLDAAAGMPADDLSRLLGSLGGFLRSISIDGTSAGILEDGVFGVVRERGGADLDEQLNEIAREVAGDLDLTFDTQTVQLAEPSLSRAEASQALVHVLKSCAGELQGDFHVSSLGDALQQSYKATVERIARFRNMVQRLEFDVVYQPIVELATRKIHHYEALSRFRGWGMTFEVVSFAEDVGITIDFDLAVVRKVLEYLSRIPSSRGRPRIAVNLSTRSLEQERFIKELEKVLGSAGSLARSIMFEITESAEIRDLEKMAKVLEHIRARGNLVGLDDFGAGASAFHYIRSLKVDHVKVDGGYVRNLLDNERDASIVTAMTELCKSLGVTTIAEMVETEDQARMLRRIGIDLGQGYLFGYPERDIHVRKTETRSSLAVAAG
ncbi:MAG: EAL domain-containing protein [Geminicoccaceae bacterium]|nr:EAL domain-containing protein [Geminicoccaceae bacterium]MCB9944904.1 EAL domain-containing protein [Geminicoccaceae bacterium]